MNRNSKERCVYGGLKRRSLDLPRMFNCRFPVNLEKIVVSRGVGLRVADLKDLN